MNKSSKATQNIQNVYPLTPMQHGMLFHAMENPASTAYVEQYSYRIEGEVDAELFEQSVNHLIKRHDILRTVFNTRMPEQPLQVVLKNRPIKLRIEDIQELSQSQQEAHLENAKVADRTKGFDLSRGPLMRVSLFKTGEKSCQILWTYHHILMDGWCIPLVTHEVFQAYQDLAANRAVALPSIPSYGRYIEWMEAQDSGQATEFWQRYLEGYEQHIAYPKKQPNKNEEYKPTEYRLALDASLTARLQTLAKENNVTLYTLLQTLWGVLLQHYNGTDDVVFGSVVSGRPAAISGIEQMIGLFINTVPARVHCPADRAFQACLAEVQKTSLEAERFQHHPLYEMHHYTPLKNDLINHILAFENFPVQQEMEVGSELPFKLNGLEVFEQTSYDLNLVIGVDDRIHLVFGYNTFAFDKLTIKRLAKHIENLATQVVAQPDIPVGNLRLTTDEEEQSIKAVCETGYDTYPTDATLHELYETQARETPDHTAVVCQEQLLTYRELDERANRVANALVAEGVSRGNLVAFLSDRSLNMLVGILGILKAGGAYIPIDPEYPQSRIDFVLSDSGASALLTAVSTEVQYEFSGKVLTLESCLDAGGSSVKPDQESRSDDLAYVIYTSGTTGTPKGTLIEHRNVVQLLKHRNLPFEFNDRDVWTLFHSFCFDFSVWEMYGALLNGGTLVVVPRDVAQNPTDFLALIRSQGVTVLNQTPTYFYQLQQQEISSPEAALNVRYIIFGGEALNPKALRPWLDRYPATALINMYGITETTVHVTYKHITRAEVDEGVSNIGRPLSTLNVLILDDAMRVRPFGVPGEMYVAGHGVARGYLNRPELTASKFVDHPHAEGERLYRTGDLARWLPEGDIEYLGRIDDQVKVRGYRIELSEIEAALLNQNSVMDAAVLVREVDGDATLCAYLVWAGESTGTGVLRAALHQRLPHYMVPTYFIAVDELPLTANGKLDRKQLLDMPLQAAVQTAYEAPEGEWETAMASIWAEVLGHERVGVLDNYFDLGGDSIKAIRLISLIGKNLSLELSVRHLYQFPNIRALVAFLNDPNTELADASLEASVRDEIADWKNGALNRYFPGDAERIEDIYPMSDIAQGMIMLSMANLEEAMYHDQVVYQISDAEFSLDIMYRALAYLAEKHDILRTFFYLKDEAFQVVYHQVETRLEEIDLTGLAGPEQESRIRADLKEDRNHPFQLDREPGWRVKVYRLSDEHLVIAWICHHALMDGWSVASLMTELGRVISDLKEGNLEEPAARLQCRYKDFVVDQCVVNRTPDIQQFWQTELEAYKRFPLESYMTDDRSFVTHRRHMDADAVAALKRVAESRHVPMKSLCFYAYLLTLNMFTSENDFVVGLVEHCRPIREDGDKLIGCFLNTIPFRARIDSAVTMADQLDATHARLMELKSYGRLSLSKIVEAVGESSYGENPFFDVIFNYVDFHIYNNVDSRYTGLEEVRDLDSYEKTNTFLDMTISATFEQLVIEINSFLPEDVSNRILDFYQSVLKHLASGLEAQFDKADILSAGERNNLLYDFNATEASYPDTLTFHQLFEQQVERTPDHLAASYGDQHLTYAELNSAANRLAHRLRDEGVVPEMLVGLSLDRSLDMLVGVLAVLKAGGAYVPIDPSYPADRIEHILSDSGAALLVTQERYRDALPFDGRLLCMDSLDCSDQPDSNPDNITRPDQLAYVIYTSGTTGKPKGVMIEHRGWVNVSQAWKAEFELNDSTRLLQMASFSFDVFCGDLAKTLPHGGALSICSEEDRFDVASLVTMLNEREINFAEMTPAMAIPLAAHLREENKTLSTLRKLVLGGEGFTVNEFRRIRDTLPDTFVYNTYGVTEASIDSTAYKEKVIGEAGGAVAPIGKPIQNNLIVILDRQDQLQPTGVSGEIHIGGAGLARGYFNRPELTAQKFIENPYVPGQRLYRTGDVGLWRADGSLEYVSRNDDQVKIRGYRIELGEIDTVLAGHPSIRETAILVKQDADGEKTLCGYFTAREALDIQTLRAHLGTLLPAYMVPTHFVQLEKMPLTPNGKIDRKRLPEPDGKMSSGSTYVAPRTDTETRLIELWRGVLGFNRGSGNEMTIGALDNFFALGGHSLKATSLVSSIHETFDVQLPLRDVFSHATVEEMARCIDQAGRSVFNAISPAPEKPHYKLSSAQKRMYVLSQLEGGELSYNMPGVVVVQGELDKPRFERAFAELIHRHEALRTSFDWVDGEPVQTVHSKVDFTIESIDGDAIGASGNQSDEALAQAAMAAFVRPFNLKRAPLLRVELLSVSSERHLLLFDMHHIVSDATTLGLLVTEVGLLYNGQTLPKPALQYKDYSEWQHELFQSDAMQRQEDYWLSVFSTEIPVLELPADYARPSVQQYDGCNHHFQLDRETTEKLYALAANSGATLYMVLLSAYSILLSKYTGQDDVIVGSPIAGRHYPQLDQVMGMFLNTLAMRNYPESSKSYSDFLNEVKQNALDAFEHQDYPFEELVDRLNLKRDMSRNPVFNTLFTLQNSDLGEGVEADGMRIKPLNVEGGISKFDISLDATETEDGLRLSFEYCTHLFKQDRIERMAEHFCNLLSRIVENPERSLADLDILAIREKMRILVDFNNTEVAYDKTQAFHQLFEQQVDATPDNIALITHEGHLTYAELNRRANQLACRLRELGALPNQVVGIMADRSINMFVSVLGVLKSGTAYLPIYPALPADRIEYLLSDSGTSILLTHDDYLDQLSFTGTLVDLNDPENYTGNGENLDCVNGSKDLAYLIYTSGTTGLPKGVMVEHLSWVNASHAWKSAYELTERDRVLQMASFSFDVFAGDVARGLMHGGALVVCPEDVRYDIPSLYQWMAEHRVTLSELTPSMAMPLMDYIAAKGVSLDSVRMLIVGGEGVTVEDLNTLDKKAGPDITLIDSYGVTEACIDSTIYYDVGRGGHRNGMMPIGRPIDNTQMFILDRHDRLQPIGIEGELCIAGDGLARGYLNRPDLTAAKFVDNPYRPGHRMYRTGDLARWLPDGNIEYTGRIDHQVKIRGYRIELGEIESRISAIDGVSESVVLVKQDRAGDKVLCAYYRAVDDLSVATIKQRLAAALPDYMIPTYFIPLDSMPVTANGKVDREALPEPGGQVQTATPYVAPTTDTEARLIALWEEVLGLATTDDQNSGIGIQHNFFELGGHSLKAMALVSKIHRDFQVELPLREVFTHLTVAEQAERIDQANTHQLAAIPEAPAKPHYALSSAQKRIYILNQLEDASLSYNMPGAVRLKGALDLAQLERAFTALVTRHEALRTRFTLVDGEPVQIVEPAFDFRLEQVRLNPGRGEKATQQAIAEAAGEFLMPFDLAQAPLLRARLLKLNDHDFVLLYDMHHIVSDGASLDILQRELALLYSEMPLPGLPIQYKDFSEWQQTEDITEHRNYWLEQFSGEPPVLDIPTDFARPSMQSFEGDTVHTRLEPKVYNQLVSLAGRHQATLYMVLLAAYNVLLSKYSGQDDIIVGSPIAGRPHADLDNVIGMFVNTLALRNYPGAGRTFSDFLAEVRQRSVDAYQHQNYPFEALVDELSLQRDLSRHPLFDTMFVVQNRDDDSNVQAMGDIELSAVEFGNSASKFDLTLNAMETADSLVFTLEYCTRLFEKETAERMLSHFVNILNAIANNADQTISDIDLLSNAERHQILTEFNDTRRHIDDPRLVHELIEWQAAHRPDAVAVVCDGERLTYGGLNRRANLLARSLINSGVEREDVVGIMMTHSLEMAVAILAVLKAGAAYLPIDPSYPLERIQYMVKDSRARIVLVNPGLGERPDLDSLVVTLDARTDIGEGGEQNMKLEVAPDNLAYLIYTSGTTGRPKGVMIEHRSLLNLVYWHNQTFDITPKDRASKLAGFGFDASVWEIFPYLASGASLYMVPELLDIASLNRFFEDNGITVSFLPTPLCEEFMALGNRSLRILLTGGDRLKHYRPQGYRLVNNYGPTESTVVATSTTISSNDARYPIGRPVHNLRTYVLGANNQLQPVGVPGELCLSGTALARGYVNQPKLTREAFVANPFEPGERMYRTGDRVRWLADGRIEYLDRQDDQIKIRGYRIELGEIETALMRLSPVREAAVVAHSRGGDKVLCAYVTTEGTADAGELKKQLAGELPTYMVPTAIVMLDQLPLTPNGKVDKRALPIPDLSLVSGGAYVAPETEQEARLQSIWAELLGVAPEAVSVEDSFFDIGGDSLKVLRAISMQIAYDWDLTIQDYFQYKTIRALCRKLGRADLASVKSAELIPESYLFKRFAYSRTPADKPLGTLLLTGATGYLGAHLLEELLQSTDAAIICLVRAASHTDAVRRLENTLMNYGLAAPGFKDRVSVLCGDFSEERFGLTEETYSRLHQQVNTVVHTGALTKHYGDYAEFERTNVNSVHRLIDFCGRDKALHLMSTVSVAGEYSEHETDVTLTEDHLYVAQNFADNVYVRSKFMAEKAVFDALPAGLNASIYRVGNLTGRYSDGVFQTNIADNAFYNLLKSIIELGALPDVMLSAEENFTPVDSCARAIVALMADPATLNNGYHMANRNNLAYGQVVEALRHCSIDLKVLSVPEFQAYLKEVSRDQARSHNLMGLASLIQSGGSAQRGTKVTVNSDATLAALDAIGINWPEPNADYLAKLIAHMRAVGYLDGGEVETSPAALQETETPV